MREILALLADLPATSERMEIAKGRNQFPNTGKEVIAKIKAIWRRSK